MAAVDGDGPYMEPEWLEDVVRVLVNHTLSSLTEALYGLVVPPLTQVTLFVILPP